mmetsp:Transcript_60165/g.167885  ORF Transcript_60165/g.167885 Transcript_60165/m.167885 type:complete len:259 (+) Transcript_60165:1416-2192(+)
MLSREEIMSLVSLASSAAGKMNPWASWISRCSMVKASICVSFGVYIVSSEVVAFQVAMESRIWSLSLPEIWMLILDNEFRNPGSTMMIGCLSVIFTVGCNRIFSKKMFSCSGGKYWNSETMKERSTTRGEVLIGSGKIFWFSVTEIRRRSSSGSKGVTGNLKFPSLSRIRRHDNFDLPTSLPLGTSKSSVSPTLSQVIKSGVPQKARSSSRVLGSGWGETGMSVTGDVNPGKLSRMFENAGISTFGRNLNVISTRVPG